MLYEVNNKVFGSRQLENCPVCNSKNIENKFKIPYLALDKAIIVRSCHLKYISTYDYDYIYKWDICNDCQTLFMNPIEPYTHGSYRNHAVIKAEAKTDYQSYTYRVNEVFPYVKNYDCLLEVGCGGGQVMKLYQEKLKQHNLAWKRRIGVEVNEATVEYLKKNGIEGYCRPFEEYFPEIKDGTVDCVMMHEVIEHLDNPYQCFRNISLMLKKGGVLSMSAQSEGEKLFFRPSENVATNLEALTDVLGKLGIKIIYHTKNSGKIRIIGERI